MRMKDKKVISVKNTVSNSDMFLNAFRWKLGYFRPKVSLFIDTQRFLIKTVENSYELEKVLKLRHEVFYREILNKRAFLNIDVDEFDFICDHLIVIDKKSEEVVGTYRIISSTFSERFYSETEFLIQNLKSTADNKLELGRACVHRDYRNGVTIALLWKGISEYIKRVDARYLFGCSSINTMDIIEVSLIYNYVKGLYFSSEDFRVYPKGKYRIEQIDYYLDAIERFNLKAETVEELVPPLLKSYLRAGSKICGEPAVDRKFRCIDFLTVLDTELLNKTFEKKYKVGND
jgi:L-ornithine Nalpha-acyltransferase